MGIKGVGLEDHRDIAVLRFQVIGINVINI